MSGDPPPVPTAAPTTLAEAQAALVRALVAGAPVPPGFDGARVVATTTALLRKRARVVAGVYPALRAVPDYENAFAHWAANRPPGRPRDDGAAFARSLGRELPLAAAAEQVAARRRRWLWVRDGLVVRWFGVRRIGRSAGTSGPFAGTGSAT